MDTTKNKSEAITEATEQKEKGISKELAEKIRIVAKSDEESGKKHYTATEVERAIKGYTRAVIQAAIDNISNTDDLTAFLGDLSSMRINSIDSWIEKEQTSTAITLI